ncbi:hypothetical protein AAMO2058_001745200, partial [Amorphochlora amoebiformis]
NGGKLRGRFPQRKAFERWMQGQIQKAISKTQDATLNAAIKARKARDLLWPKIHTLIPDTSGLAQIKDVTSWSKFFQITDCKLGANERRALTDMLTWPLTLFKAIQRFCPSESIAKPMEAKGGSEDKIMSQGIEVHILGFSASVEGERFKDAFRPLCDLLPVSRYPRVELVCIGPEVGNKLAAKKCNPVRIGEDIHSSNIWMRFENRLYHKSMCGTKANKTKPDLVVAFNSGMWCVDARRRIDGSAWSDTLEILLDNNLTTVITARSEKELSSCVRVFSFSQILKGEPDYSKRTFSEYSSSQLMEGNVRFLMEPVKNSFGSLVPSHAQTEPGARNRMWAAFKGRKK